MSATLAVTMAGRGQRFRAAGYDTPKYAIDVHGQTLFRWSMQSLRSWVDDGAEAVFVARDEPGVEEFVQREAAAEGISRSAVVRLTQTTDGQATSALLARDAVRDPSLPFVVYNIDTHVRAGAMRHEDAGGDGWIPCFPGLGEHWSFARIDDSGQVAEVREKRRISQHATVGLYWFSSFDLYASLYQEHFAAAGVEAGERYIAPMYNTLIARGGDVRLGLVELQDVVPLGTPADVEAFAGRTR